MIMLSPVPLPYCKILGVFDPPTSYYDDREITYRACIDLLVCIREDAELAPLAPQRIDTWYFKVLLDNETDEDSELAPLQSEANLSIQELTRVATQMMIFPHIPRMDLKIKNKKIK